LFDEKEKAVIHFVDRVNRASATIREADFESVRPFLSDQQIVELVLTVGVANFTNRVNDALINTPDLGE
jgi:alkylhydroperoxidase family enzyme